MAWTLQERGIKRLWILSDEPHIPWELIKPYRHDRINAQLGKEEPFWGETYALTRWLRGRVPPDHWSLRRAFTMAANADPISSGPKSTRDLVADASSSRSDPPLETRAKFDLADAEETVVRQHLKSCGALVRSLPPCRQALEELFETGDFDVLHVVSHGTFGGK